MGKIIEKYKKERDAASLNSSDIGQDVTLMGWVSTVRDLGGTLFIDLRDRSGIVQVVFQNDLLSKEDLELAKSLRQEYVAGIRGKVIKREGKPNPNLSTGEIEVAATELELFNKSRPMPFQISDEIDASEETRLKYRFLDLRRPSLQKAIMMRSKASFIIRKHFYDEGFIEVETPVLTKSTPEGARDYLVPSRISKGKFFALPQSPQLFKQLLQVSGFEKYIQIVKCFRDEDLRADRQPEFTQVDLEMSFVKADDIIDVSSLMLKKVFKEILDFEMELPVKRITYKESMERFGVDNPDVRFEMELFNGNDALANSDFTVFKSAIDGGGIVTGFIVKNGASLSRKVIDDYTSFVKLYKAKGLAWLKKADGAFTGPVSKFVDESFKSFLQSKGIEDGDLALFVADTDISTARTAAGRLRTHVAKQLELVKSNDFGFVWVTDFPMFEKDENSGKLNAVHHPFTMPNEEDLELLESNPLNVRTNAYDIVLNGQEIGGGSIRIHSQDVQQKVFKALGIGDEEAREKFGFLLDALSFGAPPHGGLAFGLDRLMSIMLEMDSIRDVIAFPKTTSASCLTTGAPSHIDQSQIKELGLELK